MVSVKVALFIFGFTLCWTNTDGADSSTPSSAPTTEQVVPAPPTAEELRLPKTLRPLKYDLKIKTYIPSAEASYMEEKEFTFDGDLTILLETVAPTNNITLNARDLNITVDSFDLRQTNEDGSEIGVQIPLTDAGGFAELQERQIVVFTLNDVLKAKYYKMRIKYTGNIGDGLGGLYRSRYQENGQEKWIAVTTCEPIDARRILPLFDEPEFKAVYSLEVTHPSDKIALANALENPPVNRGDGWTVTSFQESPKMSSYLLAIVIGEFTSRESQSQLGTLFRTWSRPSFAPYTNYSSHIGPKMLDSFEEYFGIPFPLKKMDMIALPDFVSGAMENWGLVTFREANILYDPAVFTLSNKKKVATIVSHELAHMWFGNLVTMKWWDDIWLNEGFATYMSQLGVEAATDGVFRMVPYFLY